MIKYLQTRASNKAKRDIDFFCAAEGFENVGVVIGSGSKTMRFFEKLLTVIRLPFRLKKGDVLLIQYPYKKYYSIVCRIARIKKAKTVTLIHDLGSFRRKKLTPEKENRRLSHTDAIISHNQKMTDWIVGHGCRVPIVNLGIFDYHSGNTMKVRHDSALPLEIAYAGGLGPRKNKFLYELPSLLKKCRITVYGRGLDTSAIEDSASFRYAGFIDSDDFIADPKAHWGLVWDGDSTESCNGVWGEYLVYNNPHKASFYLRAGLPVIVWTKSAMARFVEKEGIGIAVDRLADLDTVLPAINPERYAEMVRRVAVIGQRLAEGYYFRQSLGKCLAIIDSNEHKRV